MERLFSTRASGLEVISLGSVMAWGAGKVWDVARTGIRTTITNGLRMRMAPRIGFVNRGSLAVLKPLTTKGTKSHARLLPCLSTRENYFVRAAVQFVTKTSGVETLSGEVAKTKRWPSGVGS